MNIFNRVNAYLDSLTYIKDLLFNNLSKISLFRSRLRYKKSVEIDLDPVEGKIYGIFNKIALTMNKYHYESSESVLKILIALYHGLKLINPNTRIILSKGHASIALYTVLHSIGILKDSDIKEFGGPLSKLQAHPEAFRIPEAIVSTGSLGHGISVGVGLALGMKIKREDGIVAIVVGDGELDEGIVWEALATASAKSLDNLIIIVDRNGFQLSGDTELIKPKEPLTDKFRSFGFCVEEVSDSSSNNILRAISRLINKCSRPKALIVRSR